MKRQDVLIEADELLTKIDDPNLRIFDATIDFFPKEGDLTTYEKYQQAHIPQAGFFDHQQFSVPDAKYRYTVLPQDELAQAIGAIGISATSEVVIYTSGIIACATRAWWILHYAGHNNVRVLNGGLDAWKAAGGTIASDGNQYESATFTGTPRPEMFVDKEQVQTALQDDTVNTVYTLNLSSYDGKYITGTTCLPMMQLATDMKTIATDEELAALLAEEAQAERVITYCGGGIAATVNGLAHLIAGNANVAVYDGSLGEWMGEGLPTSIAEGE